MVMFYICNKALTKTKCIQNFNQFNLSQENCFNEVFCDLKYNNGVSIVELVSGRNVCYFLWDHQSTLHYALPRAKKHLMKLSKKNVLVLLSTPRNTIYQ